MKTNQSNAQKLRSTLAIILIAISGTAFSQDYGKSFVDLSRNTTASTIQPGDTLQIRATFVVKSGTYTNCSFTDAIPANSTYLPGTLSILTNEGKVYKQFTDDAGDDAGTYSGGNITINMGSGATASSGGSISNTSKPSFYGSTCIMVASYTIVINSTASFGTTISIGGGNINYTSGSTPYTIAFPAENLLLYQNYGLCGSAVAGNSLTTEYSGTFGSGTTKDRGPSSNVPSSYTYATFSSTSGTPGDYYYGISNNTSGGTTTATGYSTVNTWAKPDNSQSPSHRIFGLWDIIGDHTNASNPLLGNSATDVNSGATGGYMLVVNSAYKTDTAFLDTVSNLCPNTYYQYTAWIRNMCSKCGCDSNGVGASSAHYIPTGTGDSSGVHPNMTFNINGQDYFTTGDIPYTGQWVQKGFVFLTGPTQTSIVISVHNNAPGGGGNDWAIDDITVGSCLPSIALIPGKPDTLCMGSDDTVRYQVTSNFNNYTQWEIQQSFDNGVTWAAAGTDTTGNASSGTATPVYNASLGQYQYTIVRYYRLDNTNTTVQYRIIVASTDANLSSSGCSATSSSIMQVYAVNCTTILPVNFIYVNGQLNNGQANLKWQVADESAGTNYQVEKSTDGGNTYEVIGTVHGIGSDNSSETYGFVDTKTLSGDAYYRIVLIQGQYQIMSKIVLISSNEINFDIKSLVNPFNSQISFYLTVPNNDVATFILFDMYGRMITQQRQSVTVGMNAENIYNLSNLPAGVYSLKVQYEDKMIVKQVVKK